MTKIALIDKAPNRTDYVAHFKNEFEFDQYHLCSEQKKKILKRDVDIDIDLDAYDWIILVGSEALQNFTREKSKIWRKKPSIAKYAWKSSVLIFIVRERKRDNMKSKIIK